MLHVLRKKRCGSTRCLTQSCLSLALCWFARYLVICFSKPKFTHNVPRTIRPLRDSRGLYHWCQGKGTAVLNTCDRILRDPRYQEEPPNPTHVIELRDLFSHKDIEGHREIINLDAAQRRVELDKTHPYRVIAMALYGEKSRYTYGLLRNAISVFTNETFPGWTMRVYYDDTVPYQVMHLVQAMGGELYKIEGIRHSIGGADQSGMFWRFLILLDEQVTRYIVRDADTLLSPRDQHAVEEWISFGPPYFFHLQRDHPDHRTSILGGMWGSVGGFLDNYSKRLFSSFPVEDIVNGCTPRDADQQWLAEVIWPVVKRFGMAHDAFHCMEFSCAKTFGYPTRRVGKFDFVGNVYEPKNNFTGRTLESEAPKQCRRHVEWVYG